MPFNETTGQFTFDVLATRQELFVDPQLSNTEKGMLRKLAGPGELLHRIQASLVDYATLLEQAYLKVDIWTDEGVLLARRLQGELKSVQSQRDMWERLLSHDASQERNGEGPNQ